MSQQAIEKEWKVESNSIPAASDSSSATTDRPSNPEFFSKEENFDSGASAMEQPTEEPGQDKLSKQASKPGDPIPEDERVYLTGFELVAAMAAIVLVTFLMLLDLSIISTAIPTITNHFHSLADVGWYASSYQIANACLQPLTGKVYTHFNTKWSYLGFFLLFELGSLLCAISTSSKMLIIARAVAGMGGSGMMNGSITIVAASVPLHKSPAMIGILMGLSNIGVVAGPLIGGALTEKVSWRWCFYINLPVGGLVALIMAFIRVPEPLVKPPIRQAAATILQEFDLIGFALFTPAAIQLLLALSYGSGGNFAWGSATIIGLFCGSGGTFIVFLLWENHKGAKAMVPLKMIAKRKVWSSCLLMMGLSGTVIISSYYLPIYFQSVHNDSPIRSGVSMLPLMLGQVVFSVVSGLMIGRVGYYMPFAILGGALAAIGGGLLSSMTPSTSTGKWVGYQLMSGAGRGFAFQVPIIAIQNSLPYQEISMGMAILVFCQTMAGAVIITIANVIFDTGLKSTLVTYAPNANSQAVVAAGATGFRSVVSETDIPGVIRAYAKSFDYTSYLNAGVAAVIFLSAFGTGWVDIRKKKKPLEKV
ncbi:hypothetical protein N7478_004350 [Penicillium angulare]|uniref:uncharacterized protein n=1 Tax=Penicillium angulare TaxID=116970 RepID=UPI002541CB58|nr:uncharacterized protein N7478_004350 [Penicillium angulare]KAJ5278978.1 hypothetical protein N7478_004350 [Penicillium angulare]